MPNNQPPTLDDKQKKQYNTYRATGMPPERALSLTLQDADQKYSPMSDVGLDKLFFGKGSLTEAVGGGIKEAFTGGKREYKKDVEQFGQQYANAKKPLTYGAAVGRGLGQSVFGVLETADDLTGEAVSGTLKPVVESAVNSDVGEYLINKATEFNQKNDGVPGELVDLSELFIIPSLLTQPLKQGTAKTIRDSVLNNTRRIVDQGVDSTRRVSRLVDYFKPTSPSNPIAKQIDDNFKNLESILTTRAGQNVDVSGQLADIKSMLREGEFESRVMPMLDDFDLTPEDRDLIAAYIKNIDEAVNQDGASDIVEAYLTGTLDQIDSAAAGATTIVERLSDSVIDKSMKTLENVRNVPAAIADRVKQANDRRINRISTASPEQATTNILELYKKAIVPGVKKKNKTIATINQIDESVQRAIPELAQKYDVQDLEDFANAISAEKKAIFADIEKGLKAAGDENRQIDLQSIVDELDKLALTERADFSTPLKQAIIRAKNELVYETPGGDVVAKKISPAGAQDLIADLNAALQPQFRGARTNADDVTDFIVVNNLRRLTDEIVDDLGEGSFKELKAKYTDLKRMEDDVVHRAVFEAQKGRGLSDLTDITSAADVAAGAFSPAFLARAAGGFITKEVTKALNDKNELVRQMFLYGKNVGATTRKTKTPIKPVDDVVEDITTGDGRFQTSPNSEVIQALGDQKIDVATTFTNTVKVAENEIDLFGTKLPLNKIESEVLNNADFRIKVDTKKTSSGRKSSKQPVAFYDPATGGITFVPRKDWPLERTIQTFYHEVGHALDYKGKSGDLINGRSTSRVKLRHSGWKLPAEERRTLARERFGRMMIPTQKAHNLTEDQITDMFNLREVRTEKGRFPVSRKLVGYIRSEEELFAEAYAMFRLNPEKLQEMSPRTFEFISEIVNK